MYEYKLGGGDVVLVEVGQPSDPVQIGQGGTIEEAKEDLSGTISPTKVGFSPSQYMVTPHSRALSSGQRPQD